MMRRLAVARAGFLLCVTLAFVAALAFVATTLASPSTDAGRAFSFARSGGGTNCSSSASSLAGCGDYALAWVPLVPTDHAVEAIWSISVGNHTPDRLIIVPAQDLPDVFAGRAPAHLLAEARPETYNNWSYSWTPEQGYLRLRFIHQDPPLVGRMTWEFQCDACHDDPRPAVVWIRGDSWAGAPLEHGSWSLDPDGRAVGNAPILLSAVSNEHNFVDAYDLLVGAVLTTGALALTAGAWWAVEARRQARRTAASAQPPSTDELLRLAASARRYVEGLARWAIVGGLVALVVVGGLFVLVLPGLIEASHRHFLGASRDESAPLLVLLVPFFGLGGFGLWLAAYGRLRRERDRLRALGGDLEETTQRILE